MNLLRLRRDEHAVDLLLVSLQVALHVRLNEHVVHQQAVSGKDDDDVGSD